MICPICKGEEIGKRQMCSACRKEEYWRDNWFEEARTIFPPRIQKVLQEIYPKALIDPSQVDCEKGLYMFGNTGIGKTIHVSMVMLEIIKLNLIQNEQSKLNCAFIETSSLLHELKSSYEPNSETTSKDIIDKYSFMDVLILDDLGYQKMTDWTLETLSLIINTRYEHLKKTLITSNFSPNALTQQLGDDKIVSRIVEMCQFVELQGKDLRV